jgi:hypothetical protein
MDDPWIEELRRHREEYAARFNYDIHKMVEDLRKRERASGREYITLPSKSLRTSAPMPTVPKST